MEQVEAVGTAEAAGTTDPRPPILVAEDLTMSYRGWTALRGLSFSLLPGHVMGFRPSRAGGRQRRSASSRRSCGPHRVGSPSTGSAPIDPPRSGPRIGVLPRRSDCPTGHGDRIHHVLRQALRMARRRRTQARTGSARVGRTARTREIPDPRLQPRHAPTTRHRARARQRSRRPLPGRADPWSRPTRPAGAAHVDAGHRPWAWGRHHPVQPRFDGGRRRVRRRRDPIVGAGGRDRFRRGGPRSRSPGGSNRTAVRLQVPATSIGKATELLRAMPGVVRVGNGDVERQLEVDLAETTGPPGSGDRGRRTTSWTPSSGLTSRCWRSRSRAAGYRTRSCSSRKGHADGRRRGDTGSRPDRAAVDARRLVGRVQAEAIELWVGGRAINLLILYSLLLGLVTFLLATNTEPNLIPPKEMVFLTLLNDLLRRVHRHDRGGRRHQRRA